jgi:hypothetical protein
MGIAATGFCYPGGILQVFIDKISKFYDCRQQQRDRISTDHLQQKGQICEYRSKKSDVKIDSAYSQRYMKQRAKIVERNQATTMKKILRDFQDSIQLSRFTSELATFDWFSRYQFRSDGSLGLLNIFGLIGGT